MKQRFEQLLVKVPAQSMRIITGAEKIIIVVAALYLALGIFLAVILRYVFHAPIIGMEELTLLAAAWLYFVGAGYAVQKEVYIKADILDVFPLFARNQLLTKGLKVTFILLSIVAVSALFYLGLEYCLWAAEVNARTQQFLLSVNYGAASVVVGSGLMLLHLIIQLRREVRDVLNLYRDSKPVKEKKILHGRQ